MLFIEAPSHTPKASIIPNLRRVREGCCALAAPQGDRPFAFWFYAVRPIDRVCSIQAVKAGQLRRADGLIQGSCLRKANDTRMCPRICRWRGARMQSLLGDAQRTTESRACDSHGVIKAANENGGRSSLTAPADFSLVG